MGKSEARMSAWSGIVMGFFGAVFAAATLALAFGKTGISLGAPFVIFAVIALAAAMTLRLPGRRVARSRQARRVILWSTIGEIAGLVAGAFAVASLGHPEMLLPVTALVVGLHFFPMAWGIPFPGFYWIGLALLLASAIGFGANPAVGGKISGLISAAALWTAAVVAVVHEKKAKTA